MPRSWADTQAAFAASLLEPHRPVPPGIVECGPDSRRGFAVYRNNSTAGLVDVLQARFAVTLRLVGEEFFRAMARCFVAEHRPSTPILLEYGADFPSFIEHFHAARTVPYLADIARVELAWSEVYHAAEAVPLPADTLRRAAPEAWLHMRFDMHPAVRILRSAYPIATIWAAHQRPGDIRIDIRIPGASPGEDMLIVRPHAEVHVHTLPPGGYAFVAALSGGADLQGAAEKAGAESPAFDAGQHVLALFGAGAVVGIRECGAVDRL